MIILTKIIITSVFLDKNAAIIVHNIKKNIKMAFKIF